MFIGLDFETSGSDSTRHAPIQVGLAIPGEDVFVRDIGGWNWHNGPWTDDLPAGYLVEWSEEAFDVHRIPKDRLRSAPSVGMVDVWTAEWVNRHAGDVPRPWRNIVGWNVAGFDLAFLRRWMPETLGSLSYRTVDLNAVLFAIVGEDRDAYYEVKKAAKDYAADRIAETDEFDGDQWHDAGYDAVAALHSLDFLSAYTRGGLT